jgi:formiminotetrahydrofolate cyclodeaminase
MTDTLTDMTITTFFDQLASKAPAPGGGSVAAFTGAMGAGLLSMVCAIMLGKKKQPADAEEIQSIHQQAETIRMEFQRLAQEDIEVFNRLSAAYKLPRTTEADAASRKAAIQKLTREATDVPLATARQAAALVPLCTSLVHRSSRMLVSDVGVAVLLARSCVQSALLNVEINLASLDDANFVREVRAHREDLLVGLEEETRGVVEIVQNRIQS